MSLGFIDITYPSDDLLRHDPVYDQCTNAVVTDVFEAREHFIQPCNAVSYILQTT